MGFNACTCSLDPLDPTSNTHGAPTKRAVNALNRRATVLKPYLDALPLNLIAVIGLTGLTTEYHLYEYSKERSYHGTTRVPT